MREAGFIEREPAAEQTPFLAEEIVTGTPVFEPYQEVITSWRKNEAAAQSAEKKSVDLSALAESKESESIFNLLGDAPLFYPSGDFKTLLMKAYKNISRSMDNLALQENSFSFKDVSFTLIYPSATELRKFLLDNLENHEKRQFWQTLSFFTSPLPAFGEDEEKSDSALPFSLTMKGKIQDIPLAMGKKMVLKRKRGFFSLLTSWSSLV